jgi:hypothetical protein
MISKGTCASHFSTGSKLTALMTPQELEPQGRGPSRSTSIMFINIFGS